ncbi:hypothetical protein CBS101457_001413 [Exobasidium rhododendri]|nr:hypothetical protein CBS101457_001413 [Exobasidium rhododendri]
MLCFLAWQPNGAPPRHDLYPYPPSSPPQSPAPQYDPTSTDPLTSSLSSHVNSKPLPLGYEEALDGSEDPLFITSDSFPAIIAPGIEGLNLSQIYKHGDPHQGVIPPVFLEILDRDIVNVPPPRPADVPEYPDNRYSPNSGWSAALNGSKTSYLDALKPEIQPVEREWRGKPFDTWKPPLEEFAEKKHPIMPKIQYDFPDPSRYSGSRDDPEREKIVQYRQKLVRNAFLHSWEGYKKVAWGHDEMRPVSGTPLDPFNGWGATIVDALDTLLVMELPDEYDLARQHVRDIDFRLIGGDRSAYGRSDGRIPVFETAIRYLGGFLSAYDLSGDTLMRDRAEELAQLILPAFDTQTGVPVGRMKFDSKAHLAMQGGGVILAEAASMLLEMTRLWQVTGNRTYFDRVQRTTDWLDRNMTKTPERLGTLWPTSLFPERGTMYGWYTWGGMADSAFEYLIKEHQLLAGHLDQYGRMFADVMDSARQWLLRPITTVPSSHLLVLGQSNGKSFQAKLEHLTCFAGGTMGLSGKLLPGRSIDVEHAKKFTETCWWAYNSTLTGIGPEEMTFYKEKDLDRYLSNVLKNGTTRRGAARGAPIVGVRSVTPDYRNRPETIESIFYMWRITGDRIWQERGWQMFCSWVTHSMTNVGFSSLSNVLHVPAMQTDSMESFVFAETFKYYYLLFSPPQVISLDDYIFTTEAHPFLAPQNGVWARAGSGPQKLWDEKASHIPKDSSAYSGGEMGKVGGLTSVQKLTIYEAWRSEVAQKEAEKKAKEKSLLNNALLHKDVLLRKVLDHTRDLL